MNLGLEGVRALVVAASQGLGRACAESLVVEGSRVIISSRDQERLAVAVTQVGAVGGVVADLTSAKDIDHLVDATVSSLGGLDVLVVNCGPPPTGKFEDTTDAEWEFSYSAVVMSAVRLMRAALPHLRNSKRGRIVVITGYGIREPQSELVVSEATRAAVALTAKTIANDAATDGVTVNNIAPGPILTDRLRHLQLDQAKSAGISLDRQLSLYADNVPVGRIGDPHEIGALCAYLCSEQAGFITGQTIVVDGGINRAV
ncbi:3-oxoacyl-[acyl-carrier protein] reductase [Antricoccus suffuscus]|uniref:3-oxoacyl-[acyl-carrier protein] reductase n=1 Tax=Antricoccus suffuscus TaxID=1629062 RepID=A0A2T1A138_9ACTN|nr:SDR family oxidoreductase [Antricoccus suffuscus]PRZ42319.1 3-oxoacyl-[acyl-carrier protein] reductase [Antricoccus suffuscus]